MSDSKLVDFGNRDVHINLAKSELTALPPELIDEKNACVHMPAGTMATQVFLDDGTALVVARLPERGKFVHFNQPRDLKRVHESEAHDEVQLVDSEAAYALVTRLTRRIDLEDLSDLSFAKVHGKCDEARILFRNVTEPHLSHLEPGHTGGYFLPEDAQGFRGEDRGRELVAFIASSGIWCVFRLPSPLGFSTEVWMVQDMSPFAKAFEAFDEL